jgi:hypothetical protein
MTSPVDSQLARAATHVVAVTWIRRAVLRIGLGLPPDKPGYDCVKLDTLTRSIDHSDSQPINGGLHIAFAVLGYHLYEKTCGYAWRLYRGSRREAVQVARWPPLADLRSTNPTGTFADDRPRGSKRSPLTLEVEIVALSNRTRCEAR